MRGLGSARKRTLIKESLKKAKVDIVMIQETKLELVDNKWVRSIWDLETRNGLFLISSIFWCFGWLASYIGRSCLSLLKLSRGFLFFYQI